MRKRALMARLSLRASLLFFVAFSSTAAAMPPDRGRETREGRERVIVRLEHPLLESERAEMEASGIDVITALGRQKLLVRGDASGLERLSRTGFVREIERIAPERRLHSTAIRDLAKRLGSGRLGVIFSPDVPLEEAVATLARAGAWPRDPLMLEFSVPRTIWVYASSTAVERLTREDAVLLVHGSEGRLDPMTIVGTTSEGEVAVTNAGAQEQSNVTPLHEPPYLLKGSGIIVGVLDIGSAQADHKEFEGRVTAHSSAAAGQHPTHVTGTIAAKGIDPRAEGMAPESTVHQFSHGGSFLQEKKNSFQNLGVTVDNNSWGFITGWNQESANSSWGWYGNEAFGGYSPTSSSVDNLVRTTGSMIFFSSGNDGGESGPPAFPFAHTHGNEEDDEQVWCSSMDGTGSDCPATPCEGRCETERHPSDGVFLNVSRTASAKNVIGVGAVNSLRVAAPFSSRGPTRDGRVKPDLVARGTGVYSTNINNDYSTLQGTSMSAPVVTGIGALLMEQWGRTIGGTPGPAALKALLIHGAQDLGNAGPDYTYGFGLADAKASVDLVIADAGTGTHIQKGSINTGGSIEYPLELNAATNVRATLVWIDPELIGNERYDDTTIINDLDLAVIAPDGETIGAWVLDPSAPEAPAARGRNFRDTVEQVEFTASLSGTHKVVVRGTAVPGSQDQQFVVVSSASLGTPAPGCLDVHEPNDDPASAWGRLLAGRTLTSKTCGDSDVDFFRFRVDRSGEVRVAVGATSVPLNVSLTAPGINLSRSIPAGQTQSITTFVGAGTGNPIAPVDFIVQITPAGAVPAEAQYTITTSYNTSLSPRQRTVRR